MCSLALVDVQATSMTRWAGFSPAKQFTGRRNVIGAVSIKPTPATTSKQHCRMLQVERFFNKVKMLLRQCRTKFRYFDKLAQSRNKLNMFNLFRLCPKDEISFDIVAAFGNNVAQNRHHCCCPTGIIVAKSGNNAKARFYFVETTKFYDKIVHCCRFWQQSRTLLRHCCWCGRGLKLAASQEHIQSYPRSFAEQRPDHEDENSGLRNF